MKIISKLTALFILVMFFASCSTLNNKVTKAEKHGWKLSIQSFSFHKFSVIEALDKTHELGIKYIELFPGQQLGGNLGESKFNYNLSSELRKEVLDYAKKKNIKIVSTGVLTPRTNEWEKIFEFAKDMQMEYISTEPNRKDWDIVEQMAKKYGVKVAVHNHPRERSYWSPEVLLNFIGDRSVLIGGCVDVGHYKRMGVEPISALKKLEGRIISLHFKDIILSEKKNKYQDVIWGQGILNVKGILEELKRQNFRGYFSIEYEANWENNMPEIRKSIEYFNQVSKEIL